ncbi:MAG TPA: flagellar motor protein MotB [Clostridiaceae bacterium]
MRKRKEEKEANSERWLLTYSDLITLLMIFFVVMYSMSNIDKDKFKALSKSLNSAMSGSGGNNILATQSTTTDATPTDSSPIDAAITLPIDTSMQQVKEEVDNYLTKNGLTSNVSTSVQEKGLVINITDTFFFDTGKAEIIAGSIAKLVGIGNMLTKLPNSISIEGHTDSVPINGGKFADNLDLSAMRASTVTRLLINQCHISPSKISATGYGETRPIAANTTIEGRAKNRRVDIVVYDTKYDSILSNNSGQ